MGLFDLVFFFSVLGIGDALFFWLVYRVLFKFSQKQVLSSMARAVFVSCLLNRPSAANPSDLSMLIAGVLLLFCGNFKNFRQLKKPVTFSINLVFVLPVLEEVFYRYAMIGYGSLLLGPTIILMQAIWFTLNHSPFSMMRLLRALAYGLIYYGSNSFALTCICHVLTNVLASFEQSSFSHSSSSFSSSKKCVCCGGIISDGTTYFECAQCAFNVIFVCESCRDEGYPHKHSLIKARHWDKDYARGETVREVILDAFDRFKYREFLNNTTYCEVLDMVKNERVEGEERQRVQLVWEKNENRMEFWIKFLVLLVNNRVVVPLEKPKKRERVLEVENEDDVIIIVYTTQQKKGCKFTNRICLLSASSEVVDQESESPVFSVF